MTEERGEAVGHEGGEPSGEGARGLPGDAAASFDTVFAAELEEVRRGRGLRRRGATTDFTGATPRDRAHAARLAGLAFSGGGIRSATFNLGVLQGLARLGWLDRFDYFSVNSGGGYIGGWFGAWVRRSGLARVIDQLANDACRRDDAAGVAGDPAAEGPVQRGEVDEGQGVEPAPVFFLRRFSNYLTPRLGALSADTWTLVATYLRNLLLTQTVLVLALAAILLAPRLALLVGVEFELEAHWALVLAALALLVGIAFLGLNQSRVLVRFADPLAAEPARLRRMASQGVVQLTVVVPLFLAAWLASLWVWHADIGRDRTLAGLLGLPARFEPLVWIAGAAAQYLLAWVVAALWLHRRIPDDAPLARRMFRLWRACLLSAAPAGALGGLLLWLLTRLFALLAMPVDPVQAATAAVPGDWGLVHVTVVGPPLVIGAFLLTAFLHTGLMGRAFPEELRQWWSRLGAWLLIYSVTWLGVGAIAIYGPMLLILASMVATAVVAAGWGATTLAGVLVGKGTSVEGAEGRRPAPAWKRAVIAAAPQVFIVGLLALVAFGVHGLLRPAYRSPSCQVPAEEDAPFRHRLEHVFECNAEAIFHGTEPVATLGLLGVLLAGAVVLSWRLDVNEFSMHLFYRNRLIRAYLGASNKRRRPQPFTGFDSGDDLPLASLRPGYVPPAGTVGAADGWEPYDGPYPIHNATLNLVKGQDLAYQQRKGAAFVFTPLACGYPVYQATGLPEERQAARHLAPFGFRPTGRYRQTAEGVTLGTAMGVSGAAASPNMGAQTTPAMAFLLTVFNVRLGWWLGNPRHDKTWRNMGPGVALFTLLDELFGSTDERSPYVYLSDGGHFDNSSIYELVRRRCRLIVATDAGADPAYAFADLANVVRKCCTDFGVEIDVHTRLIDRDEAGASRVHCAVGSIRYARVDGGGDTDGVLLYLKASLTGDEPADVRGYRAMFPVFPHQPTSDQFFDESQFESYRKLGEHIVQRVVSGAAEPADAGEETAGLARELAALRAELEGGESGPGAIA